MPWELIIPIFLEILKDCMDNDSEESVTRRLKSPDILVRFAMRRALVKFGLRGKALRDAIGEGMDMLKDDPSLADELVAAAKEA